MAAMKPRLPKPFTLSDFIRLQPADATAAEVVQMAKADGFDITEALVHKVRGGGKAGPKAKAPASRAAAPAPAIVAPVAKASAPAGKVQSKAAFVRSHGHLSPKQIVEAAKRAGIKLAAGYVYYVRATTKSAARERGPGSPRAIAAARAPVGRPSIASKAEALLRAVAAEIGLGSALAILHEQRASVRAILGG